MFFLWIAACAQAQEDPLSADAMVLDQQEDAYMTDSLLEVYNAIKFDPFQVLRGELMVFYERRISNRISLELGAGITRRNWSYALFDGDADDLRRNITVLTGPTIRLGARYYFKDSPELNGAYLMPQAAFRVFDKQYAEIDSTGELNGRAYIDHRQIGELNLTFGYQHLSLRSNFFYDIYAGMGYAVRRGRQVNRVASPGETLYMTQPLNADGWTPVIGVKFGWGF